MSQAWANVESSMNHLGKSQPAYITITGMGMGMGMGRTVRHSAYRYGPDRVGTFINSQFSVSIFNLTKKLAHFVMGGSYVVP